MAHAFVLKDVKQMWAHVLKMEDMGITAVGTQGSKKYRSWWEDQHSLLDNVQTDRSLI